MKEDLRKSCYSNAKAKHGPKTHHICFYFGYGANSFGKKNKMRRKGGGGEDGGVASFLYKLLSLPCSSHNTSLIIFFCFPVYFLP